MNSRLWRGERRAKEEGVHGHKEMHIFSDMMPDPFATRTCALSQGS